MEEEESHWEEGLPLVCGGKKGGNKGGGCSSSIVLDSKGLPVLPPPPHAEEAINRLNAGWPGGSSLIG